VLTRVCAAHLGPGERRVSARRFFDIGRRSLSRRDLLKFLRGTRASIPTRPERLDAKASISIHA
jgi:hypothetical protein